MLAQRLRSGKAALVMGAAVWCFLIWWPQPPGRASLYAVGRLGAAVALGGAIYLALTGIGWLRKRREANGDRQSQGQG